VKDNIDDCVSKGRNARGEAQGLAKLTEKQVVEIRELLARGDSQRGVARRFGVSHAVVHEIFHGRTWRLVRSARAS
jgi:hypothetical protein